jgi:FixJ family two-component response regulator
MLRGVTAVRPEMEEERRRAAEQVWTSRADASVAFTPSRPVQMDAQPLICVVDDDESVRESLPDLLRELGFAAKAFASAREFLTSDEVSATRCLLLDVAMPEMSGPQLQQELMLRGSAIRIIFITARIDATVRQQLLEQGAVDCLFKPFSEEQLRKTLGAALRPT